MATRLRIMHDQPDVSTELAVGIYRSDAAPGEPAALRAELTLRRGESAVVVADPGAVLIVREMTP